MFSFCFVSHISNFTARPLCFVSAPRWQLQVRYPQQLDLSIISLKYAIVVFTFFLFSISQKCALVIHFLSSGLKKRSVVLYMSILSIVTPIGVLIGIIVTVHMEQVSIDCHPSVILYFSIVYFCIYVFLFLMFCIFVHMSKIMRRPEELMCWQSGCCKAWRRAPFSTSPSMRSLSLYKQHHKI